MSPVGGLLVSVRGRFASGPSELFWPSVRSRGNFAPPTLMAVSMSAPEADESHSRYSEAIGWVGVFMPSEDAVSIMAVRVALGVLDSHANPDVRPDARVQDKNVLRSQRLVQLCQRHDVLLLGAWVLEACRADPARAQPLTLRPFPGG